MIYIFLSVFFAYLTFPNLFYLYGFSPLAWIFAIPLFFVLENKNFWRRCLNGLFFGLLFYACLVRWMTSYNELGYYAFVVALSIQPVVFASFLKTNFKNKFLEILYPPALWVTSEFLRPFLFHGFSWTIGYSQSFNPGVIQIVDVLGSYGISFVIILVNYCLFKILKASQESEQNLCLGTIVIAISIVYGYGFFSPRFIHQPLSMHSFKICTVQPNINPHQKLNRDLVPFLIDQHVQWTQECLPYKPDLIVWPETSVPDDFRRDGNLKNKIIDAVEMARTNFLIGAALSEDDKSFNSAVLLDERAQILNIYHKKNLVPFSEYQPFKEMVQIMNKFLNMKSYEFEAGRNLGVFSSNFSIFGVGICSEDAYPETFRQLALKNVGFIILMLNDGWFIHPEALVMHAQNSIMRAVENRIPIVRAANTGLSCSIDVYGNVSQQHPALNTKDYFLTTIPAVSIKTFYTKYGDFFAVLCTVFVIISFVFN